MLEGEARAEFERWHQKGLDANGEGRHGYAHTAFEHAHQLAIEHDDIRKQLDALNPDAKALWSMQQYDEATKKLMQAADIAERLDLPDEAGIAVSNLGRLMAAKIVQTTRPDWQINALDRQALPHFKTAYEKLRGHGHLYFRYANDSHGSVIAALTGDKPFAKTLILDGLSVAFRRSPEPYDQKKTYKVNPKGLGELAVATVLLPFGNRTPKLAAYARRHIAT